MKSNFYEKIIPIKNEKEKNLLNDMNKLLDESISVFIDLRTRQANEKENKEQKQKQMNLINESVSHIIENEDNNNEGNNNSNNNLFSRLRDRFGFGHEARMRRIMNMEEEIDNLDRLINNENIEVIG